MFDNFVTKCTKPAKVEWVAPNKMKLDMGDDDGFKTFELLKGAETYIHKQIDIKLPTSKELYKKAEELWRQLRDKQLDKCMDRPRDIEQFNLEKDTVVYLTNNAGEIVDIADLQTIERLEEFKDKHEQFVIDITTLNTTKKFFQDGKNGLIKFVCYDTNANVEGNDYTPVVIIELNNEKSSYKVYSGILVYKDFTFMPSVSCDLDTDSLYDFINRFNMKELVEYSTERAPELYESYLKFKENPYEISARELTALLKKVGYKFEFDSLDKIEPIENLIDEENNKKIQDFYNTFTFTTSETAYDILKLSDFRKTFRYNKITLLETLGILSKEYLTYEGSKITAEILGDIVYKLYDTNSIDKAQVKLIETENN